jgi:hypothetical protein
VGEAFSPAFEDRYNSRFSRWEKFRSNAMAIPNLNVEQIQHIVAQVADFIAESHEAFRPRSQHLTQQQRDQFAPYFPENVLNDTRFIRVDKLANPPFYPELERLGFAALPQFSAMAATTFVDVIAAQVDFYDALRFHELVHVVQYRQLGLQKFAERYVLGFLNGGGYDHIPLEENAYELERRFMADRHRQIDVLTEVNRWIREDRF